MIIMFQYSEIVGLWRVQLLLRDVSKELLLIGWLVGGAAIAFSDPAVRQRSDGQRQLSRQTIFVNE